MRRRSVQRGAVSLVGLAFVVAAPFARAEDETASCIAAHVEGQRLARSGEVRAARDALVRCARPTCPTMLVEECTALLADVERAVATVVFALRDAQGRDVADAQVLEGGQIVSERLDGRAIELDPGEHTFTFQHADAPPVEVTVVVREGDKGRRVEATLAAPDAPTPVAPEEDAFEIPVATWILGATGVIGVGLFAGLGAAGLSQRGELDDLGCKPNCDASEVDGARGLFLAADISLAIGAAALIAGGIVLVVHNSGGDEPSVGLRIAPSRDGTAFAMEGSF